jgi:DNA-binding transcriptional ArsR family regulator
MPATGGDRAATRDATDQALTSVDLSPAAIRVLAHPLRARLLSALRVDGPATATTLAASLGTNTVATSYHLRKLASVGLVADAEGGRTRERRWKAAHDMHSWFPSHADDDPDARAASDWLAGESARRFQGLVDAWRQAGSTWPAEWRDAAGTSDYILDLTADQLDSLMAELHATIQRAMRTDPSEGQRRVFLYLHALPRVDGELPTRAAPRLVRR